MIDYIKGGIALVRDDHVVLEAAGVGHVVKVSDGYRKRLAEREGLHVCMLIHEHAKEASPIELYGFDCASARDLFKLLISVRGVGPGTALTAMSRAESCMGLARMIAEKDVDGLKRCKAFGPKTIDKVIAAIAAKVERFRNDWHHGEWGEGVEVA